jgi:hypothetical protein
MYYYDYQHYIEVISSHFAFQNQGHGERRRRKSIVARMRTAVSRPGEDSRCDQACEVKAKMPGSSIRSVDCAGGPTSASDG